MLNFSPIACISENFGSPVALFFIQLHILFLPMPSSSDIFLRVQPVLSKIFPRYFRRGDFGAFFSNFVLPVDIFRACLYLCFCFETKSFEVEEMGTVVKEPTRRSRLEAWLREHRVSKSALAVELGVSYARMLQLLRGVYLDSVRRQKLVSLGIPSDLLPEACDD